MQTLKINDWESKANFSLRFSRWFLLRLGLWEPKKSGDKILFKLYIFLTFLVLTSYFTSHTLYILLVVKDPAQQLILFGPLSFCIMAIGKYIFAVKHIDDIATCAKYIEEDWKTFIDKPEEKQLMSEADRKVDYFTQLYIFFMIGGTLAHNSFLPITKMIITLISTPNATVMLHAPFYFGGRRVYEDSSQGFMFIVMLFYHTVAFVFMNVVVVGLAILTAKCIMHACCQIELMLKNLERTVNKANDENWNYVLYQANFKLVVIKHLRILRFIDYIEEVFTGVFFIEFILSTIGICVLGYYILGAIASRDVPQLITFTSILVAYVISIYIYCWLGNRLTDMCELVGTKAYEINWTGILAKYGDGGMQMIIMMAQHPPVLTAGKIFFLTVETFTSVMKASAAYLNMLRTVTDSV